MEPAQFVPKSRPRPGGGRAAGGAFARRSGPVALRSIEILGFDELAAGDEWESPARTVTEADVVHFAALTGDFNPIHVDRESAAQTPFGRPIAHGLLGLSFAAGLTSAAPRVDT